MLVFHLEIVRQLCPINRWERRRTYFKFMSMLRSNTSMVDTPNLSFSFPPSSILKTNGKVG